MEADEALEWLNYALKKLGIAETDVVKIEAEIVKQLPKHFVPKSKYNDAVQARKQAEEALAEREKQLEASKKCVHDKEELEKQLRALEAKNKDTEEQYEAELKELRMNCAIQLAVASDVHDPELVAGPKREKGCVHSPWQVLDKRSSRYERMQRVRFFYARINNLSQSKHSARGLEDNSL